MILSFYNRWTIIFTPFLPILIIPFSLLFTYTYYSTPGIWYGLLIINIMIGISEVCILLKLKSARYYYFIRTISALAIAIPILYTTMIILKSNFTDTYLQILSTLFLMMIVEWFLSYYNQKIRLAKALELKIPNNAIDVDDGVVNLQTMFLFSPNDENNSRVNKMLAIGRILMIFAPILGSMIYRLTTPEQQSMYFLAFLSTLAMVFVFGSGVQAGVAVVIRKYEDRRKMRFLIKDLV